ncbi:MAG: hypothetical protein WC782_10455 [Methylococcaceae bacterium]|jgi:hypothetical protein
MQKLLLILSLLPVLAWPAYPELDNAACYGQSIIVNKQNNQISASPVISEDAELSAEQKLAIGKLIKSNLAACEKKIAEIKRIEHDMLHFSFFKDHYSEQIQSLCFKAAVINAELAEQKTKLNQALVQILKSY